MYIIPKFFKWKKNSLGIGRFMTKKIKDINLDFHPKSEFLRL